MNELIQSVERIEIGLRDVKKPPQDRKIYNKPFTTR